MSGNNHSLLNTSVVKKYIVAASGLFLALFVLGHSVGNSLMLFSSEMFNRYGDALITNPLIYVVEFVVGAIFLTHVFFALKVTLENYRARGGIGYKKRVNKDGNLISFAAATMPYTGGIILIFLVFHIVQLKYGAYYEITYAETVMRDLHILLLKYFSVPLATIGYVIAMVVLTFHVLHGLWSITQTFGVNRSMYNKLFRNIALGFAMFVLVIYVTFPIWAYLQGVK